MSKKPLMRWVEDKFQEHPLDNANCVHHAFGNLPDAYHVTKTTEGYQYYIGIGYASHSEDPDITEGKGPYPTLDAVKEAVENDYLVKALSLFDGETLGVFSSMTNLPTPEQQHRMEQLFTKFDEQAEIALSYANAEKPKDGAAVPSVFELQVGHLRQLNAEIAELFKVWLECGWKPASLLPDKGLFLGYWRGELVVFIVKKRANGMRECVILATRTGKFVGERIKPEYWCNLEL